MIKTLGYTFAFILLSLTSYSQEVIIKSQIIDNKSGIPIPYANIFIQKKGTGTVSNKEGKFNLLTKPNDTIQISILGYQSRIMAAKKIKEKLKLSALTYTLNEITIHSQNPIDNPEKIIQKCIKRAPTFRPEKHYLSNIFLKQSHLLNTNYIKHIEAALNCYFIPKKGLWNINVNEKRNSHENRTFDFKHLYQDYLLSKDIGIRRSVNKSYRKMPPENELTKLIPLVDQYNFPISKSLNNCFFACYPNLKVKRNLKTLFKQQQFKIDSLIQGETENYYKIKILPTHKELRKYPFITVGYLLISMKDFAIHEVEIAKVKNPQDKRGITSLISGNGIQSKIKIRYKKLNGKLYPTYYSEDCIDESASCSSMIFSGKYPYIKRELVFCQNILNQSDIQELTPKKWQDNLYLPQRYHEKFWHNFPTLSETKNETILRKFLEAQIKFKSIKSIKK